MVILCDKKECSIERNLNGYPNTAVLMNCDGELHLFFDTWSDDQIYQALDFANQAHSIGFEKGKLAKIYQIRQALKL